MFNSSAPSIADIAAINDRDNDWWWIILFALFGGWGNNGWGNNGDRNAVGAEVQRGFDTQAILGKLDGINNGLCDGFYAVNTGVMQGNFDIQRAINGVQQQVSDCCCTTNRNIDQVRFDAAQNTCNIITQMNQGFAQLDRTVSDKFCELEMKNMQRRIDEQQNLINALNLAQSQANQTQQIIDTVRPCPIPAYQTCNPWATNGAGYTCGNSHNNCGC